MVMEHLIACGAKYIIGIGLIAAIQPEIATGTLIVPTKAIRGEGTSYYLPEDVDAVPDRDISQSLRKACRDIGIGCVEGEIYTTDAVHRETRKLVEALWNRNILGIDMETSAIFSVGIFCKVKTCCILIASTNQKQNP